MVLQLFIGTIVIVLCILTEAAFIIAAQYTLTRHGAWFQRSPRLPKVFIGLSAVTLVLMAAHSVVIWIWAATLLLLGVFDGLEPALYFSIVAFTTLGFGDVLLPEQWRLLSGLAAANGLLIFGVSTAFIVEFFRDVRADQGDRHGRHSRLHGHPH